MSSVVGPNVGIKPDRIWLPDLSAPEAYDERAGAAGWTQGDGGLDHSALVLQIESDARAGLRAKPPRPDDNEGEE